MLRSQAASEPTQLWVRKCYSSPTCWPGALSACIAEATCVAEATRVLRFLLLPSTPVAASSSRPWCVGTSTTQGGTWLLAAITALASSLAERCGPQRCAHEQTGPGSSRGCWEGPYLSCTSATVHRPMLPSRHAACECCAGVPTSLPGCPVLFEKGEQRRACQRKHQRPITDPPTHHAFLQEGEGVLPEAWKQQVPLYPELERLVVELLRWGEAGLGG